MAPTTGSDVLTVRELAERLRIAPQTAYRLCKTTGFPASRVGGQIRIPVDALEEWLHAQRDVLSEDRLPDEPAHTARSAVTAEPAPADGPESVRALARAVRYRLADLEPAEKRPGTRTSTGSDTVEGDEA
jgi:excisionase family DNA binding protein